MRTPASPSIAALAAGVLLIAPIGMTAALAQHVDHDAPQGRDEIRSIVVIDGQLVSDVRTPPADSGLTVSAQTETAAESARRDAVDLLNGGGLGTRPLEVTADTQTVIEARGVVSETATKRAKACVQIGVIGAQAECRPN